MLSPTVTPTEAQTEEILDLIQEGSSFRNAVLAVMPDARQGLFFLHFNAAPIRAALSASAMHLGISARFAIEIFEHGSSLSKQALLQNPVIDLLALESQELLNLVLIFRA